MKGEREDSYLEVTLARVSCMPSDFKAMGNKFTLCLKERARNTDVLSNFIYPGSALCPVHDLALELPSLYHQVGSLALQIPLDLAKDASRGGAKVEGQAGVLDAPALPWLVMFRCAHQALLTPRLQLSPGLW